MPTGCKSDGDDKFILQSSQLGIQHIYIKLFLPCSFITAAVVIDQILVKHSTRQK
jgi:hypothetical protein